MRNLKILAVMLFILALLTGCLEKQLIEKSVEEPDTTLSPEDTVDIVLAAIKNGETAMANFYLKGEGEDNNLFSYDATAQDSALLKGMFEKLSWSDIRKKEENGNYALVTAIIDFEDFSGELEFRLTKEDGYWKVWIDSALLEIILNIKTENIN